MHTHRVLHRMRFATGAASRGVEQGCGKSVAAGVGRGADLHWLQNFNNPTDWSSLSG